MPRPRGTRIDSQSEQPTPAAPRESYGDAGNKVKLSVACLQRHCIAGVPQPQMHFGSCDVGRRPAVRRRTAGMMGVHQSADELHHMADDGQSGKGQDGKGYRGHCQFQRLGQCSQTSSGSASLHTADVPT